MALDVLVLSGLLHDGAGDELLTMDVRGLQVFSQ
jgi:hypothetical protein